ncbi:methyltransferase [Actinoplanes sp. CA-030573]|uniref:methyltransferase n=1 Tax=Actinoplanes sp. CA-030573 TaxID=3239898 RepID=UPI003D92B8F2
MTPPTDTSRLTVAWWRLTELADGFLVTQLLYAAAELRLADVLADGCADGPAVARAVGADPDAVTRILRGLCAAGVFAETDSGRFSLGPLGEYLRDGVPGSQRGPILARGALYYPAAVGLLEAARTGGNAFEQTYGESFFDHLQGNAARRQVFEASMAGRARHEAEAVVAAYDLNGIGHLVDVGAGSGLMARAALRAVPSMTATLLDRPATLDRARAEMADADLTERCTFVAADFFASVPGGGDAYLLSRVLHDWPDQDAVRILRRCRAAMPAHARLLVVDAVMPERARDVPAAIRMDLLMMLLLGGRERRRDEFGLLFAASGFSLRRVVATGSPTGLAVLEVWPAG